MRSTKNLLWLVVPVAVFLGVLAHSHCARTSGLDVTPDAARAIEKAKGR